MDDQTKELVRDMVENPRAHFSAQEMQSKRFNLSSCIAQKLTSGCAGSQELSFGKLLIRDLKIVNYAKQLIHAKS